MRDVLQIGQAHDPTLAEKVAFLSRADAYPHAPAGVIPRESHMSWVFLAGQRVYKLKKPVKFPYLDFSTLARREAACRAEFALNRRLARDVYLGVVPLLDSGRGLVLDQGPGTVVDWLVVMRRLDEARMLDHSIATARLTPADLDRLVILLSSFYRHADRVMITADAHLIEWWRSLAYNRRVLLDSRVRLADGLVRTIDRVQRRFLFEHGGLLKDRIRRRAVVDGHGDLRPEHIWLGDPPRIIDCLEFNPVLRANDPFDEIAFLMLECERLGASWACGYLYRRMMRALPMSPPVPLFLFYRSHRAMLRARLAIAHLLEPNPRTPERWPALARTYLRLAAADARSLEAWFRTRVNPSMAGPRAGA